MKLRDLGSQDGLLSQSHGALMPCKNKPKAQALEPHKSGENVRGHGSQVTYCLTATISR